jgi:DNA polymerase-3 subunit delta
MPARSSIYAFLGTDEALVKEAALAKTRELAPPDNEFGLEIVSGAADNSDQAVQVVARAIEAIQTLPFFGGEKVVWLQGVNFLGESQTAKADSTLSALETLLEILEAGLPSDVAFVLSAGEIDKRRVFYKRLAKVAKVEVNDRLDATKAGWESAVIAHAGERAGAFGLKFRGAALERFVQRVGADTRVIDSELEKLSLYVGDRAATEDDVAAVTSLSHKGYIFDIGEAIARRDLPKTIELIDFQLNRGENAIGILLAAIVSKVRNLLHARDLVETHGVRAGRSYQDFQRQAGALPSAATAHLSRTKEGALNLYPLFLAAQASGRFTLAELRAALDACLEANLRLVTTQLEPRLVLHQLVARILAGAPRPESAPARRR